MPAARAPRPGPVRRFLLGSGPLERTSDRLQALSRLVLLLAVLAVVPLAGLVGTSVSGHLHEVARQQQAHRASVPATLLFDAARTPSGSSSADEVAPLGDGDIAADAVAAVVLGPVGALALVALGHVVLVTVLDRRRARRWAEGWAAVEPLWRAGRH